MTPKEVTEKLLSEKQLTPEEKAKELVERFKAKYEQNYVSATFRALKCTEIFIEELSQFGTNYDIDAAIIYWSEVRKYLSGIRFTA